MKRIDFQPVLFDTLKNYSKEKFFTDLMAGIIVGIVLNGNFYVSLDIK